MTGLRRETGLQNLVIGLLSVLALVLAQAGRANADDIVLKWNQQVLNSIRAEKTPPPIASRALAMTHIAIYDSLNYIEGKYTPYTFAYPGIRVVNPSADVAASTAAFLVLKSLYPNRESHFASELARSLRTGESATKIVAGAVWGTWVAEQVLKFRKLDGSQLVVNYVPSGLCGRWKPTLPAFAPALLPQWPRVHPFAVSIIEPYRAAAPPGFSSKAFGDAYSEVKRLGSASSTARTPDQTQIAYFWEDGAGTVTPPGHWQVIAAMLSERRRLSRMENARLFALLSIAQADAAICCWDSKYAWDYFRPITAIRERCFNRPDLAADSQWTPLLPSPPFPGYTSGHSTFSGASARVLALVFGTDRIAFSMASPDPDRWPAVLPGVTRRWTSLSQAAEEAGQSRIYGGIHFQFDNTVGLKIGRAIGNAAVDIHMRPLRRR